MQEPETNSRTPILGHMPTPHTSDEEEGAISDTKEHPV